MPKSKVSTARKTRAASKPAQGIMGKLRALSSKQRILVLVLLFAALGSILAVTSEAASLTNAQKSQLTILKQQHENTEDAKKAQCKQIENRAAERTCKDQLKDLKNRNDDVYDNLKDSFKRQNKAQSNVCGVSTVATHINNQGHDGAPGSGSSSGSNGSSGTGSSGASGSGSNSSSSAGASGGAGGSNGASGTSGSNGNSCQ